MFFVVSEILYFICFNSCCVDHVTAAHTSCDAIIHFGLACLSRDTRTSIAPMHLAERIKSLTVTQASDNDSSCSTCTCARESPSSSPVAPGPGTGIGPGTPSKPHNASSSAVLSETSSAHVPVYYCFESGQLPAQRLLESLSFCFPDRDAPILLVPVDLHLQAATGSLSFSSCFYNTYIFHDIFSSILNAIQKIFVTD